MGNILEYLYRTYIRAPINWEIENRYKLKSRQVDKLAESFAAKLPEELLTDLNALKAAKDELADIESVIAYTDGFIMGSKILIAVLTANGEPG